MARPENRSEARSLNLTLPEETFNYLVLLATRGSVPVKVATLRMRGLMVRLDEAALERALGEIVRRHEALRTVFPEVDGSPVQVIAPFGGFALPAEMAINAGVGIAADHFAFFKERQVRIDHPGAGAIGAVEHRFDLADQVVAMARLLGDQCQQQQFQVARGEHPGATSTAFAAGARAFFEAVTAFAVMMMGMMVSHFSLLSSCLDTT